MKFKAVKSLELATGVPIPVAPKFWQHMKEVESADDIDKKKEKILWILNHREEFFQSGAVGFVGADGEGWYPFLGDVADPETGNSFDPPMTPYRNLQQHDWGGVKGNYTSPFILACTLPFTQEILDQLQQLLREYGYNLHAKDVMGVRRNWAEVAVLTNGLCGSACALVQSRLEFAHGATIFTYGGQPGQKMDSAAFAGGNVLEYHNFWPMVLYSAVVGDIIHGEGTPIGKRLRMEGAARRHYAQTLLLPLPTGAKARFNFNMMFVKEMGPKALPREWYIMPAHHHYWRWIQTSLEDEKTWEPLKDLYIDISQRDWETLRNADPDSACAYRPAAPEHHHHELGLARGLVVCLLLVAFCVAGCCAMCGCCSFARPGPSAPGASQRAVVEMRSLS
eukprot:1682354-Amphidinium_carterae.1